VKRDIGGEFPFHFFRFILGRGLEGHKRKRPSVEAPGRHRPVVRGKEFLAEPFPDVRRRGPGDDRSKIIGLTGTRSGTASRPLLRPKRPSRKNCSSADGLSKATSTASTESWE
jgi:hypothetical protein